MTSAGGVDVWRITGEERAKHDSQFFQLKPVNGFITGEQARGFFMQSGLQTQILGQIWTLADMNGDGKMDKKEFSIAMHLIKKKLQGYELPKALPPALKADPSPVMGSFGTIPGPMGTMPMAPVGIGFPAVGMVPPVSMAMGVHTMPMMTNGIASISAPPVFMGGGLAPATPATGWAGPGTVTATQSPAGGMALPHQSKLKYTQVFNANDRNKRGFLTGVEARAILVQSGVPQPVLAQIWSLSDVDRDGQLTCDEFCIAMHLIDIAKMGQALPPKLPPELLPPSTKGRAGSFTNIQGGAVAQPAVASAPKDSFGDLLGHMGMSTPPLQPTSNGETKVEEQFVTFEDRRKENFDKGQAELDKRRQMLADQLKREEEARREKERQEEEKRERIRQDQERRRLQELERQLEKQRELEREREEHRRKMMEQRDAARKELERQRQMEWERQRKEQLLAEKTREYQQFMSLKSQSSNLKCELESLEGKKNEINQKISQVRKGVMDFTTSIESMRSTRDIKLAGMEKLQKEFQEINSKLQQLQRDREQLNLKVQTSVQSNPISETHRTMMHSVELKKTTVQRLRKDLEQIDKDKELKLLEKEKFNSELKELNNKIGSVQKDLANLQKQKQQELNQSKQKQEEEELVRREKEKQDKLRKELEAQRLREEEERKKKEAQSKVTSSTNWFDFGGDAKGTSSITDNWPSMFNNQSASSGPDKKEDAWDAAFSSQTTDQKKSGLKKKYKAMFQFDARNVDELSLLPGDIVLIPEDQSGAEPGWMNGEIGGKTGYFPEAYVQPLEETEDSSQSSIYEEPLSHHIPTISTSEESSFIAVPGRVPDASPTPGQGKTAPDGLQAQALYVWKAKKDNHLSFNKGDIINVREQQDMWWSGEISGKVGWFPKSYVKLISGPFASSSKTSSPAMTPSIPLDKASSAGSVRGSPAPDKKEGSTLLSEQYVSIYNYQSSEAGDLTFNQGEIILVTKCEGDWWTGSVGDKTGIFPATYVKKMETPQLKQVSSAASFDSTVESSLRTSLESAFSQLDSVGSGLNWGTLDNDPFSKEDPFSYEDPFSKDNFGDDDEDHLYDTLDDVLKSKYSNEMFPEASASATANTADLFDFGTQKADSGSNVPFSALKNMKSSDLNVTDPANMASNLAERSSELELANNEDGLYETYDTVQTKDTSFGDDKLDLYEGIFKEGIFKDGKFIIASPLEGPQPLLDNGINTKKSAQTPPASLSKEAGLEDSVRNWAMSIFDDPSDASLGAEVAAAFSGSGFGSKTLDIRDDVDSVEIDAQSSIKALGTTSTLKKPEIATVIASYTATGTGQLSLQPGQLLQVRKKSPSGWWEGELQARGQKRQIGWFPANYVKLLSSGSARSTPDSSRGMSPALVPSGGGSSAPSPAPARPPSSRNLATKYVDHVVALYPYGAQNEDELTFPKDAVINVISKEDADWWQGEFNGQVGMFPSNYVSSLGKESESWSADPQVLASTSTEEGKRQSAVHELINTEEVYVSDLSTALDAFYNPLATAKAMTEDELQAVFVNWHDLRICNTKLNKAFRVRKKIRNGQVIEVIGDILCEYLPHMSPYIRFCSCQLNAAALLQRLSEGRPLFNEIHKKCVQNPKTKGMPLSSFLLKPMQRITKYPLLIEKILKYTPEGHPDHQHLTEALAKAEELCNQVNEGVREKENSDRLEQLQKLVVCDGLPEKITFNSVTNCLGPRKLVHSGVLYKSKSNKELVVFMFNDFLLLTQANRPVGSNSSLQQIFSPRNSMHFKMYKTPLVLNEVMIKKPTEDDADPCQFQLNHVDRLYHFKCSNQNESPTEEVEDGGAICNAFIAKSLQSKRKDTWLKKIEATIKNYQDTERKKREKAHSLRRSPGVGRLLVVILEGADLQASDENGKSDPYCEVSMGAQEHRTKVIPATLNPKWNQSMQFTIRDMEQDVLCITVFDRDLFSPNDFLGRTEKRVKDIHNSIKEKGPGPVTERLLLHEVPTGEVVVKFDLQLYDTT